MRASAVAIAVALFVAGCAGLRATEQPIGTAGAQASASIWMNKNGITACGVVRSYTAAGPTAQGSLAIGSRTYTISPGTPALSNEYPIAAGKPMCVWGGLDASSPGTTARAEPLQQWRCGRVRVFQPATPTTAGRLDVLEYWSAAVASFVVPPGSALGSAMPFDSYRCLTVDVDAASGDAIAARTTDTLADVEVHCGVVKTFQPPTSTSAGSIVLGSKTITLPAGSTYQGDPAGFPTDTTAAGKVICFNALLGDAGEIRRYGPHRDIGQADPSGQLPGGICGRAAAFRAPTATSDGYIAFSLKSSVLHVPAGTAFTSEPPCADLRLDAQGDVVVLRGATPQPVRL